MLENQKYRKKMILSYFQILFAFVLISFSSISLSFSQTDITIQDTISSDSASQKSNVLLNTINSGSFFMDSIAPFGILHRKSDSANNSSSKDFLETKVIRSSDSSTLNMRRQKAYLYGNANVSYGNINLTSAYMEIDFQKRTVYATGLIDSSGKEYGKPVFKEGETTFSAEKIIYNFETKQGLVYNVITQEGEGYLHGTTVKKLENDAMFIKDGWFTTCNNPEHPHFAFKFGKAKVIPDDKIVTGPVYLMIEDIPTPLALPFGWFPNMSKRRSGIVIPSINQKTGIGFGLESGGYYWYINDNLDLKLTGDIFTRGSWALQGASRYAKRYSYNGNVQLSYAKNIKGDEGTSSYYNESNYRIFWQHQQDVKARPNSSFSANVNIQSSNYQKFNSVTTTDYLTTSYSSSVSYSTKLSSKLNLSANLGYTQNTSTKTITLSLPKISLSSTQIYPFRRKTVVGSLKWYENIYISYTMNTENKITSTDSTIFSEPIYPKMKYGMKHTIPIKSSVKLFKFLNWNNAITYNEYWYGKSIQKSWMDDPSSPYLQTDTLNNFFATRDFNLSSDFSTTLYGMFAFKVGPLKAIRHVLKPTVGFSYHPDFGTPFWGNYKTYIDANGEEMRYNIYEGAIYGGPSDGKSGKVNFALNNNLEIKVRNRADTITGTKKIKLINSFTIATSYDIAKDSLKWSKLYLSGNSTVINGLQLSYSANFDPYILDSSGTKNLNKTEWEVNKRLFRFNDATWNVGLTYTLNPETFKSKKKTNAVVQKPIRTPNIYEFYDPELFIDWNVKWSVSFNYSLSYTKQLYYNNYIYSKDKKVIQTLGFSGNTSITPKWKVTFSSGYDFQSKKFTYTTIGLYRDLHCWEMSFNWTPFGFNSQWNFSIKIKANMLKDFELKKKKDASDNW